MLPRESPEIMASHDDSSLCRIGGRTCGGCCWAAGIPRPGLERKLARHRRLFARLSDRTRPPSPLRLLLHELRARRGLDLILAVLQWVPWLGPHLARRFADDVVCAFAAFEDEGNAQVGCLLHPTRCGGKDARQRAAFRLLKNFGCGAPDYSCEACLRYSSSDSEQQAAILQQLPADDWFDYSQSVVSLNVLSVETEALTPDETNHPDQTTGSRHARHRLQDNDHRTVFRSGSPYRM